MLTVSGNHRFYFIPGVTDMRFGYHKLLQIIKNSYHMNPKDGSFFVFMSKNRKTIRMVNFEAHAYNLHQKTFTAGYSFMKLEFVDQKPIYHMEWKDLMAVLESPVVKTLRIGSSESEFQALKDV